MSFFEILLLVETNSLNFWFIWFRVVCMMGLSSSCLGLRLLPDVLAEAISLRVELTSYLWSFSWSEVRSNRCSSFRNFSRMPSWLEGEGSFYNFLSPFLRSKASGTTIDEIFVLPRLGLLLDKWSFSYLGTCCWFCSWLADVFICLVTAASGKITWIYSNTGLVMIGLSWKRC